MTEQEKQQLDAFASLAERLEDVMHEKIEAEAAVSDLMKERYRLERELAAAESEITRLRLLVERAVPFAKFIEDNYSETDPASMWLDEALPAKATR